MLCHLVGLVRLLYFLSLDDLGSLLRDRDKIDLTVCLDFIWIQGEVERPGGQGELCAVAGDLPKSRSKKNRLDFDASHDS